MLHSILKVICIFNRYAACQLHVICSFQTGFYREDDGSEGYSVLGYYCAELLRSTRLVVDTGIHAFRWTREQVSKYN